MKIFDSELNILEVLWEEGDVPAKRVSKVLGERLGWNKNTTYTVIKKCIDKGYVAR
ncbi:MAG: BlaI/MecI/CopY family transcriptional regulator, partial [bacterium]